MPKSLGPPFSFSSVPFLRIHPKPHLLSSFQTGPFIDTSHASVKSGKLPSSLSPLGLFQQAFLNPLQSFLQQNPDSLVLLVPHVRDLLNSHNVFPQGLGDGDFGQLPSVGASSFSAYVQLHNFIVKSIKVLPNPCLFSLNSIRFGVSTVDVLYHLKNQQYIQRPQQPPSCPLTGTAAPAPQDVMANLCRHVLEQRRFAMVTF